YLNPKEAAQSWRPKGRMSPGLLRARAPYRLRNAITGVALLAFCVGVYAYSLRAVSQDTFEDLDEEARHLAETGVMSQVTTLEDEQRRKQAATTSKSDVKAQTALSATILPSASATSPGLGSTTGGSVRPKGVLAKLLEQHPGTLDPGNKTLVWGAPSVDTLGSV
ncbi:hypothetical protein FISHEDRAFT_5688, partial [Fistulina hepatica ATCC 64428]